MSGFFTVACPHCGNTSTFSTGISKNGSGVGNCRNCHKTVRIYVDSKGNIKKVTK